MGAVLPPLIVLALQSLVLGKGLNVSQELRAELKPADTCPPEVEGSCRWTLFEDGSWTLRVNMRRLSKEMAFQEGLQEDFTLILDEETKKARWTRSVLSTPEHYEFTASLEGKSPTLQVGHRVSVLRRGEPILTGILTSD